MNNLRKPMAAAGVQIQLVTANAYVDLAVIVGNQQICEFRIEERHRADDRIHGRTRTTGTNYAVVGWAEGLFSRDETRRASLHDLACFLAKMGLDVTPILQRAGERGWPREIIDEAAEAAERARLDQAEPIGHA